jgi:hypothetical protein
MSDKQPLPTGLQLTALDPVCKDFAELRVLIEQARARAMNDAKPGLMRPRLGVGSGELVMA